MIAVLVISQILRQKKNWYDANRIYKITMYINGVEYIQKHKSGPEQGI
jgi:hypothetical protein